MKLTSILRSGLLLAIGASTAGITACGGSASGATPAATQRPSSYVVRNLVSDGFVTAEQTDADLVNPWGIVPNPALDGLWWVSDNATAKSTLYDEDGIKDSLIVGVPGEPTGIVFYGGSAFVVDDGSGNTGSARFLFASLDGTISGWSPAVPPPPPSTSAFVVYTSPDGAAYTGLAIAGDRLYAADLKNEKVDVLDGDFAPVSLPGAFRVPAPGYGPFGIQAIGDRVYVAWALHEEDSDEEEARPGAGFVEAFDLDGRFVETVGAHGRLNAPWGIAMAPSNFGSHSGQLLVGNFGDGRINAFERANGHWRPAGQLQEASGRPITIEGLWGIAFGNGGDAGPTNALFFAAGPEDETHGLFGRIDLK